MTAFVPAPQDPPTAAVAPANQDLPGWLAPAAFLFGVAGLIAVLALIVKIPKPTEAQFNIFRTIIAISGSAFATGISGFLIVNIPLPMKGGIVAGGALAVFVLLYKFGPAEKLVERPQTPEEIARSEVNRLHDEIISARGDYEDLAKIPDNAPKVVSRLLPLVSEIMSYNDGLLRDSHKIVKREYAGYGNAILAELAATPAQKSDRAQQARLQEEAALKIADEEQAKAGSGDSDALWVTRHIRDNHDRERSGWVLAWACALEAHAKCPDKSIQGCPDSSARDLVRRARTVWSSIDPGYTGAYSVKGTPDLEWAFAEN